MRGNDGSNAGLGNLVAISTVPKTPTKRRAPPPLHGAQRGKSPSIRHEILIASS